MSSGALARRYARALLELGKESQQADQFADDLKTFGDALGTGDGLLASVLGNPGLTTAERRDIVQAILARLGLSPLSNNFINLLVDKNRIALFAEIQAAYQAMADEEAGRVRATITTAVSLDGGAAGDIKRVLEGATGKQVLVDYQIDPELIGGIVARVGDTVYDASIRARLHEMKEILSR